MEVVASFDDARHLTFCLEFFHLAIMEFMIILISSTDAKIAEKALVEGKECVKSGRQRSFRSLAVV